MAEGLTSQDLLNLVFITFKITYYSSIKKYGVPAVAQWVKNPVAAVIVTVEAWVLSPAQCSGLKDQIQSLAQELSYAAGVAITKKKCLYGCLSGFCSLCLTI